MCHTYTHHPDNREEGSPHVNITKTGADLQSKVATNGTVRLVVDHSEEHYELLAEDDYLLSDFTEIESYLHEYGYHILDHDECPAEITLTGWRLWAAHVRGEQFGFANVKVMATVTAIGVFALLAPKVGLLMDLVAA